MTGLDTLIDDGRFVLPVRLRTGMRTKKLVVLLHGVGGNETNLAGLAAQFPDDTAVALVRGPLALGPGQFAWFRVAFTASGPSIVEAEAEQSRRLLIALLAQLRDELRLRAEDVTLAGFSQGGIMSAGVVLTRPQAAHRFAILSGRILPEIEPMLATSEELTHVRGYIAHGRLDGKLPVSWAERADALLERLGVMHELHLYDVGHELNAQIENDFLQWYAR